MDVAAELALGTEHHQVGRLDLAARCYKQVLLHDPGNADALHLMGVLAHAGGEYRVAAELAVQAINAAPDWFAPYVGLGNAAQALGDLNTAEQAFRAAIRINDQVAEAWCNLANLLNQDGRHDEALQAAARSVSLDASLAEGHNNFGNALMGLDSADEAAVCYRRAVKLKPDYVDAWINLGGALAELDDGDGALAAYDRALVLGEAPEWHSRRAEMLGRLGRFTEAEAEYRHVLAASPNDIPAMVNLAAVLGWQGRYAEAMTLLNYGLERHPESAELHWNLAIELIRAGRMAEAWPHFEARWRMESFQPFLRDFGCPAWDGVQPLAGRTVLVHAEQGYGDAIQFSRFVPALVARGAKVLLECRSGLARLMATLGEGVTAVETGGAVPAFDLTVPLLSLGSLLGVRPDSLPGTPYLAVPEGAADFADVAAAPGLKVGLVWSGSRGRARNAWRSLSGADLAMLMDVPGVSFFGLQLGGGDHPSGAAYTDLSPRLGDFADTAAAIMALDLVVTVDTAVAHLAGALGKPVWVMLSQPCDGYFWMTDRGDSPWYPTARLIRQNGMGDWAGVLAQVRANLLDRPG